MIDRRVGQAAARLREPKSAAAKTTRARPPARPTCSRDLLTFGLIPDIRRTVPVSGVVHNLDKEALMRILRTPKNALVKQYQ